MSTLPKDGDGTCGHLELPRYHGSFEVCFQKNPFDVIDINTLHPGGSRYTAEGVAIRAASLSSGHSLTGDLILLTSISQSYDQKGYGHGTSLIPSRWPNLCSGGPDHSTEPYCVPYVVVPTFDFSGFALEASS